MTMMPITVDPEFANLCPILKPEERLGLEADLVAAGRALDALKLWGDILLDGHNRHEICARLDLPFDTAQVPGIETREQARNWIISNQLNRRNLSPNEASYLRGKRYNAEKLTPQEIATRWQAAGVSARRGDQGDQNDRTDRTSERLAKDFGVAEPTVRRDGAYAAAVDSIAANLGEDVAREIRAGQVGITRQQVRGIGKMEPAQQASAIKQAKAKPKQRVTVSKLGKIKPMERAAIGEKQKEAGQNFLHALRLLDQLRYEPELLARMSWPENWRAIIDDKLANATSFLADFSASWKHKENGQ